MRELQVSGHLNFTIAYDRESQTTYIRLTAEEAGSPATKSVHCASSCVFRRMLGFCV